MKSQLKSLLLLLGVISLQLTFSQQKEISIKNINLLVHKSTAERMVLLTPFYEEGTRYLDSVKIFSTIYEVERQAKKHKDKDLEYEVALMYLHFYGYRDHYPKSFTIREIKKLDKIAKNNKVNWLEIRTQSLLANYLSLTKDYGNAIGHFERTAFLLEKFTPEEFPLKQICLYQLGNAYINFKDYNKAKEYLFRAIDASSTYSKYYYEMHITNTLGFCYYKQNELESSDKYYQLTLDKAIKNNDKVWESIVNINLSKNASKKGNNKEAISFAQRAIKLDMELGGFIIHNNTVLGNALLKIEKVKPAIQIGEQIEKYIKKNGDTDKNSETYFFLSKIASHKKNARLSANYLDNAIFIKDSLNFVFDRVHIDRTSQQIEVEQSKFELEKQKQAETEKIWFRNSLIIALFLILIILILTLSRQRLKIKAKEEKVNLNQKLLTSELKYATESLEGFKKSINDKNKMITHFEKELNLINKQKQSNTENELNIDEKKNSESEIIQQLISLAILTKKDWREFVQLFEKAHQGFFDRLRKKSPNLTESEVRLMALSRLQLDNKEMALILGVGAAAIRQSKSRLRKKLQLTEPKSIEHFSLNI